MSRRATWLMVCVFLSVLVIFVIGVVAWITDDLQSRAAWQSALAGRVLVQQIDSPRVYTDDDLLAAIRQRESCNGKYPIGSDGISCGSYGITPNFWEDGLDWALAHGVIPKREGWEYETAVYDEAKCEVIIRCYWLRHEARTLEQKARMHRGGPHGPEKDSTVPYWWTIREIMEARRT